MIVSNLSWFYEYGQTMLGVSERFMLGKIYIHFLLLFAMLAICASASAHPRSFDHEEEDDFAWEIRPKSYLAYRSNPLIGRPKSKRIFSSDLDISYYGENFFFDDVVGYTLYANDNFMFNSIASPTEDFILFNDFTYEIDDVPELRALEERNPSLNGGVELIFNGKWGEFVMQLQTDLLGIHKGHIADFSYAQIFSGSKWDIRPTVGLIWKSSNYVDYFYGVSATDARATSLPEYDGRAALNWYFSIEARYQIIEDWNFVTAYYVQYADEGMADSPLLESDRYIEALAGVEWVKRFNF